MKKFFKRALFLILLTSISFFISGCWDRVEIDERAFVLGAAIDLVPRSETRIEPIPGQIPLLDNIYKMSVEVPLVSQMVGSGGTGSSGKSDTIPRIVLGSTGADIAEINRAMSHRSSRILFYGHQKVLILGEELAREDIRAVFDFFERNPEPNKRIKVLVAEGEAAKVLQAEPKLAKSTSLYIFETMEHERYSSRFVNSTFGKVISNLRDHGNTLIARVRGTDEGVVVGGSAIIKDWKMVGWLGELETGAALMILGEIRGGIITITDPRVNGPISLRINECKGELTPHLDGDEVKIVMDLTLEGDIFENMGRTIALSKETIDILQGKIELLIEETLPTLVEKVQKEFNTDIFRFDHLLMSKKPKEWEELKGRWDEIFPQVKFEAKVRVRVRRFGVVR